MSAKTTGHIWDIDIPAAQRLVLLAMADHADHDGEHIHAPIPYIAWKTGYSARNTARIIESLIADGLLIVTTHGLGESNEYKFSFSHAKLKRVYKGRKPKKTADTHDKMSSVKNRTHDKMSSVSHENVTPPDMMSPPHDKMSSGTHDKMAIDHDQYHLESDLDLPPPTNQPPTRGGGGGELAETDPIYQLFSSRRYGIKAAAKLGAWAGQDVETVRAVLEKMRAAEYDPTEPQHLGSRLFRNLKPGPALVLAEYTQPKPANAPLAPTRISYPSDVLTPQQAAETLARLRKKQQEAAHDPS